MAPAPGASGTQAADDKILGIELLRFASAVAVLVFHFSHFSFVGLVQPGFVPASQPFFRQLGYLYANGFYGVEVFWCISGFIFYWKYSDTIAMRRVSGKEFFLLRFSRLYPLHIATLVLLVGLQQWYRYLHGSYFVYRFNDAYHFVLQLFMASNWGLQHGDSFNGPIWSISIEVLMYAAFFLSLRFISNSMLFMATCAILATAGQILLPAESTDVSRYSLHMLLTCATYFYLGCVAAGVYNRAKGSVAARRWVIALCVVALAALLLASMHINVKPKYALTVFAPAATLLCVLAIPASPLVARWLVPAGNMTYSSYLLHVPLQITTAIICTLLGVAVPVHSALFFVVYLAGTLWLSHWVYGYFEMPAQRWIRKRLR